MPTRMHEVQVMTDQTTDHIMRVHGGKAHVFLI